MNAFRHTGVNAAARDGKTLAAVAVDEIQLPFLAVPQVFHVCESGGVRAKILQKIVASAGGDAGHGGVVGNPAMPLATSLTVPSPPQA